MANRAARHRWTSSPIERKSDKLEYQYFNFGNSQFTADPAALVGLGSYHTDENTFKVGINYWLGGPVARSSRSIDLG
jgi:hypothetical protein